MLVMTRNNLGNKRSDLYDLLEEFYKDALFFEGALNLNDILYNPSVDHFEIVREYNSSPYPGIKVHSYLDDTIYKVLTDPAFINAISAGLIFGFKVYESPFPKQVTIYIGFDNIGGYSFLLNLLKNKYNVNISPKVLGNDFPYAYLNRLYISKNMFIRYSTDFYDEMVKDLRISDSTWRSAADNNRPNILALARDYLTSNFRNIISDVNKWNSIFFIHPDSIPDSMYTVITLQKVGNIAVPVPQVILGFDPSKNKLITYDIYRRSEYTYNMNDEKNLQYISNHPVTRISEFLSRGYIQI